MKIRNAIFALVFLTGCLPDFQKYKTCNLGIHLEGDALTCKEAEYALVDALGMLSSADLVVKPPDTILFRKTLNFHFPDGTNGSGLSGIGWLETNFDGSSLAHELIHQKEIADLDCGSSTHKDWYKKGYYGIDMFWVWFLTGGTQESVDIPFCTSYVDLREDHAQMLIKAGYPVVEWRMFRARVRKVSGCND
jgi:hypothetical protein